MHNNYFSNISTLISDRSIGLNNLEAYKYVYFTIKHKYNNLKTKIFEKRC